MVKLGFDTFSLSSSPETGIPLKYRSEASWKIWLHLLAEKERRFLDEVAFTSQRKQSL
jgi:hypothetical protein